MNEKIKYLVLGFVFAVALSVLIGAKTPPVEDGIGRYQGEIVSISTSYGAFVLVTDTKTGEYVWGRVTNKTDRWKGSFHSDFESAEPKIPMD